MFLKNNKRAEFSALCFYRFVNFVATCLLIIMKNNIWKKAVSVQLIGYETKIVNGTWNCGIKNTEDNHIILNRQAPHKDEITGIKE